MTFREFDALFSSIKPGLMTRNSALPTESALSYSSRSGVRSHVSAFTCAQQETSLYLSGTAVIENSHADTVHQTRSKQANKKSDLRLIVIDEMISSSLVQSKATTETGTNGH